MISTKRVGLAKSIAHSRTLAQLCSKRLVDTRDTKQTNLQLQFLPSAGSFLPFLPLHLSSSSPSSLQRPHCPPQHPAPHSYRPRPGYVALLSNRHIPNSPLSLIQKGGPSDHSRLSSFITTPHNYECMKHNLRWPSEVFRVESLLNLSSDSFS